MYIIFPHARREHVESVTTLRKGSMSRERRNSRKDG